MLGLLLKCKGLFKIFCNSNILTDESLHTSGTQKSKNSFLQSAKYSCSKMLRFRTVFALIIKPVTSSKYDCYKQKQGVIH